MASRDHFVNRHVSDLIQKISVVRPVIEDLEDKGLLTNEQCNRVYSRPTCQEQMRELYHHVKDWDYPAKDTVYECLRAANPSVIADLESRPGIIKGQRPESSEDGSKDSTYPHLDLEDHLDMEHNCAYGDITKVDCTGASQRTARQNALLEAGVEASHKMAQMDSFKMRNYRRLINSEARCRKIDPAIIAAIISRESRAGDILINGWGHDGKTFGLMQVCQDYHDPVGEWNSEEHIEQATGILIDMIESIQTSFPDWSKEQQLKGGIAAYNCGNLRVESYEEVDKNTVSHDYSNDVVARAQWYKQNWHLLSP